MSTISTILVGIATKVGAPIVKSILSKALGDTAGGVAGTIIDAIAEQAGVTPAELPSLPADQLEKAVAAIEQITPELVDAHVRQQAETNRLLLAEMDKGPLWSWAWRPGGMYLFGLVWLWTALAVPGVNLFLGLMGATQRLELGVDVATLLTLSGGYIGLYMGGHTVKSAVSSWATKSA